MALKINKALKKPSFTISPHAQKVIDKINATFGENTVVIASKAVGLKYHRGSTGSFGLDIGTGGGFCFGRIQMIIGKESASKTSVCLHTIANAQKRFPDCLCAFLDMERTFDPALASAIGVDLNRLLLINPDSLEQSGDVTQILIEEKLLRVFVLDSWAALSPTSEIEDEIGKSLSGRGALLKNRFMRKILAALKNDLMSEDPQCMVIIINHINMNIGVTYGSPETDTGGMGKNYFSSIRVKLTRTGNIEEEINGIKRVIGIWVQWKVIKNKTDAPQMEGIFPFYFASGKSGRKKGIDQIGEVMEYAKKHGIIPDKYQRRTFLKEYAQDPVKFETLKQRIRTHENSFKTSNDSGDDGKKKINGARKARGKKA